MPAIWGIQRRPPFSHSSSNSSSYDHYVDCSGFTVRDNRTANGESRSVGIFFHKAGEPAQGVGITLPSRSIALALARALMNVGEGNLRESRGEF